MPYLVMQKDGRAMLNIYVQPRASRLGFVGMHDGCLKLAIPSPPVDDKANKAVVEFLADFLGISPKEIHLRCGRKSRRKQLIIGALGEKDLRQRIEKILAIDARKN